jgi:5-methylcytosine-specific restriction protein A
MRAVEEWIGETDDTDIPPRVRARVFEAKKGRCHRCGRKIMAGDKWTCEHLIAIENGGQNRESNLDVTCHWCLPIKNREDAAAKKKSTKVRYAHLGIKQKAGRKIQSRGFHRPPSNTRYIDKE